MTMFYDAFEAFLWLIVHFVSFMFSMNIWEDVSVGDLFIAIFISRVAFTILIKGANVGIDSLQTRQAANVRRREAASKRKGG